MIAYVKLLNKGEMQRLPDGKKMIATKNGFETIQLPKWANKDNILKVESLTDLKDDEYCLAIHTGLSNICVLDFDNELFDKALHLNDSLSEDLRCTQIHKSVNKPGGHFIYEYEENDLTTYINNANGRKFAKLDTLYGNCLVYATTRLNKTKVSLVAKNNLVKMPLAMQLLVINYYSASTNKFKTGKDLHIHTGSKLALLAMRAMDFDDDLYSLLNIIVQPRHKELMAASAKNLPAMHPDRIPDGEGYNFLLTISAVLTLDPSIDKELHKQLLFFINSKYSTPLETDRVMGLYLSDIAKPEYTYNPNWMTETFSIMSKNKELIEYYAYQDANAVRYFSFNNVTSKLEFFATSSLLLDAITLDTGKVYKKEGTIGKMNKVRLVNTIDMPFGKNGSIFNSYKRNKEQEVFYNPALYMKSWEHNEINKPFNEDHPRYPKVTLAALRNACGDNLDKFLAFMRRKYSTREHSPLFFIFFGVPHSFKTAVVNGVFSKLSEGRFSTITPQVLMDKYNSWQVDKDLILLDEAQYISNKDLPRVISVINTITGSSIINGVRKMYSDVSTDTYPQRLTFVVATNEPVNLTNEANERRMVIFESAMKVSKALGMEDTAIASAIRDESINFAYYLATQIANLDDANYTINTNWKTKVYDTFQEEAVSNEQKLADAILNFNYEKLFDVFMALGGTPGYFNRCVRIRKGAIKGVNIVLYNSRPDIAGTPGLFDNIFQNLNKKALDRRLSSISHVSRYVNDVRDGYAGNKMCLFMTNIPQNLIDNNYFQIQDNILDFLELKKLE